MERLSKEESEYLHDQLRMRIPEKWFGMIRLQRYVDDFEEVRKRRPDSNIEILTDDFAKYSGYCADAIYERRRSEKVTHVCSLKFYHRNS
jgi:hypothetical protein